MIKNILVATLLAVAGAFMLASCAVTSGQSSVGEYVDDATVSTRVKAKFAADPQVSAMRLNVDTLKGVVQLSGFATSETEKTKAGELARDVPGVVKVQNNIVVRPPSR